MDALAVLKNRMTELRSDAEENRKEWERKKEELTAMSPSSDSEQQLNMKESYIFLFCSFTRM